MIVFFVWNQAFQLFTAGYAAAAAYVLAFSLLIVSIGMRFVRRRREEVVGAMTHPARRATPRAGSCRSARWHLVLVPVSLLFALPLVWLVVSSFMTNAQINRFPPTIIPDSLHLDGYRYVLQNALFPRWFLNSMIVALVVVVGNLVFGSLAGYAFARMRFRGSKAAARADARHPGDPVPDHDDPLVPADEVPRHHRHARAR